MCGLAGMARAASFALRISGIYSLGRMGRAHLYDGSPGATTVSCHLGASSEVHATVSRLSATWRSASPTFSRWVAHSQEVLFRSSLCVWVRRTLGESDGPECSTGSSVGQERSV